MITVHQNLRLDDRYQPSFLAEHSEHGERLRIRFDAGLSWNTLADRNHRAPLGEARSEFPILLKSLAKAIESLRDLFSGEFGEGYGALVHFDTWNDALLRQHFGHQNAVPCLLMQRLVKQDHTADGFVQPASRKEQLTIAASGFFRRRNINVSESLRDCRRTFIRRQNAFALNEESLNR